MARLAFAQEPRARIDDREIRRPGPSFTVDTLEELARERPRERLRLLIGGDQALNFASWRQPERIETLAEPVVVPRPPLDAQALRARLAASWASRVLDLPPVDTSSTQARALLARGERPDASTMPPSVATYAIEHGLYRDSAR